MSVKCTSEDNGPGTESMALMLETQGLLISSQAAARLRVITAQRDRLAAALRRMIESYGNDDSRAYVSRREAENELVALAKWANESAGEE